MRTSADFRPKNLPDTVHVVDDHCQPRNIQRWWRTGIFACPTEIAVIVNDDVIGKVSDFTAMADLQGHTLSMVEGHRLSGWCFGLDTMHGIHPDPDYVWWCGDDDLALRAFTEGEGVKVVRCGVKHLKWRKEDQSLKAQIKKDCDRLLDQWGGGFDARLLSAVGAQR